MRLFTLKNILFILLAGLLFSCKQESIEPSFLSKPTLGTYKVDSIHFQNITGDPNFDEDHTEVYII